VVAPTIFRVLGPAGAGDVVSAIFPRYYAIAIWAGAVALGTAGLLGRRAAAAGPWTATMVVLALGLAATLWAGLGVHPRAQRLRATVTGPVAESAVAAEFRRLHRRAVALNGASLLAALVGLGLSARALRS